MDAIPFDLVNQKRVKQIIVIFLIVGLSCGSPFIQKSKLDVIQLFKNFEVT